MKRRFFIATFALLLILLGACKPATDNGSSPILPIFQPTATLPSPSVTIIPAPDAQAAMRVFLEAWKNEDFASMYAALSKTAQENISQEDFTKRYQEAMDTMSLSGLDYEIFSAMPSAYTAQVAFRVTYQTYLLGDLQRDMVAHLRLESEQWRLQWDDSLILPELAGGNKLAMECRTPARGDIYDRDGQPLVAQTDAVALGIIPGQVNPKTFYSLTGTLERLTDYPSGVIEEKILNSAPDWYIPVGEITAEEFNQQSDYLTSLAGLIWSPYQTRFYFEKVASQTIGYVLSVPAEELAEYRRKGYCGDEKIGYSGLEKWGEEYLSGKRGGSLYVTDAQGQVVTRLGQSDPQPANSLYLTIDRDLQEDAERAIAAFNGAVVVLERDTGRVLAMASSPTYDANLFAPNNPNNSLLNELFSDTNQPLVNRATQGQYPLGSVFKVITFASALESGLFLPENTYDCQYEFKELPDRTLYDWTWEHCQDEKEADPELKECKTEPSGVLTLPEGLMRSCNPWFWHIGLSMYSAGHTTNISNMARAFGLGQPTGIGQVAEAPGTIQDPTNALDATNGAIGQGTVQVTPLQVATFVAAIGNGGTLYRPQLVERVQPVEGDPIAIFKPEARGTLPLNPENLQLLQDTMVTVIADPRGTANFRLRGLRYPAAGKTGTAESGSGLPHAWFAGYSFANIEGVPDIAVAVIVENVGEGSDYAAPVFKRMLEAYFLGSPQSLFWWEASYGVPKTPTPIGGIPTKTPKP